MWWWLGVAHASALEIEVADPKVTELVLTCADGVFHLPVAYGSATWDHVPQNCKVAFIRGAGLIDKTGRWSCTNDECTQREVSHQDVANAPGRVNVIATTELPKGEALELTCGNGYRTRVTVTQNTAVFDGVPDDLDCELNFKGALPATFHPIRTGTWNCRLSGSQAICTKG